MNPYWIYFRDRVPGCVEAPTDADAMIAAKEFGEPIQAFLLPYPASPRLGEKTDCPSFCFQPGQCKGKSCCPRNISCVE